MTQSSIDRCYRRAAASLLSPAIVGAFFALLAGALVPGRAVAQPAPEPGVFTEVLDVRVVNIEIVVTDKKGNRVSGLPPEDFAITVDGQGVPVEYFTEVETGRSIAAGASSGTVPALAPGEPVATSYLVFIDEYFALRRDRDRALERLAGQVARLGPEDRMAIVAFDGERVEMLSSWSQSPEVLARVLDKAAERPSQGLQRLAEQRNFRSTRQLIRRAESGLIGGGLGTELSLDEEDEAMRIADQMERIVLAASSALRGFANPPGRKVMLLLSGGWPYNPAQWVVEEQRLAYASRVPTGDELYAPLVETANRLSYTLYPVDLPRFETSEVLAAVSFDNLGGSRDFIFERNREVELTLFQLARETGGRALINSNADSAFEQVAEDTRSYYWLGFTPTWEGDDAEHDIDVIIRRPGLEARFRKSFSDLSRSKEVTMMVESSLLFGNTAGVEGLPTELGAPTRAGRGKINVPFRVAVPVDEVTFLPTADGVSAHLELRVAVIDDRGNRADIPVIPIELRAKASPEETGYSLYENMLRMRKRPHRLVFSLYDTLSGKILSSRLDYDPEAITEQPN